MREQEERDNNKRRKGESKRERKDEIRIIERIIREAKEKGKE